MTAAEIRVFEDWSQTLRVEGLHGSESLTFPARHDLYKARRLIDWLNGLTTRSGVPIYNHWQYHGRCVYPFLLERLFWEVIVPWVLYREAFEAIEAAERPVVIRGGMGWFRKLWHIVHGEPQGAWHKRIAYSVGSRLARLNSRPERIIFYSISPQDFRTEEIRGSLSRLGITYSFARTFSTKRDWRCAAGPHSNIFLSLPPRSLYSDSSAFAVPENPEFPSRIVRRILDHIDSCCRQSMEEISAFDQMFRKHRPGVIYGIDDVSIVNPLIAAASLHQIPTIGHQHSTYTKWHYGWMRHSLPTAANSLHWSRLMVWGTHWKRKLLQHSRVFGEHEIEIACPMRAPPKFKSKRNAPATHLAQRTILIPYEFLADVVAIGKYIDVMLDKGWRVVLKVRPDEVPLDQLGAYCLQHSTGVELTTSLSDALLSGVDAIAGTSSSLLYELLVTGIPVWYLETRHCVMEELVADGFAHSVTHDVLDDAPAFLFEPLYAGNGEEFFSTARSMDEVVAGVARLRN